MYTKEDDQLFQKAIIFAGYGMEFCYNKKPALVHSLRVAFYLYQFQYDISIVVAAVLHDLLEDTSVSKDDIAGTFGLEIADLVALLTTDPKIKDYKEQYFNNFSKIRHNQKALIIRCADIMDNAPYIKLASLDMQQKVKEKYLYFYDENIDKLQNEPILNDFMEIIRSEKIFNLNVLLK